MNEKNIIIEPEVNDDETFVKQVKEYMQQGSCVYLSADKQLLIDKHMIPVFDIRRGGYAMLSETQIQNSYMFLEKGANIINRLLKIIDNFHDNSVSDDKNEGE